MTSHKVTVTDVGEKTTSLKRIFGQEKQISIESKDNWLDPYEVKRRIGRPQCVHMTTSIWGRPIFTNGPNRLKE